MAQIVAKIMGGSSKDLSASTVGEVKRLLNATTYQANVNGSPAEDSRSLSENDFVTLSPAVKAGN